MRFATSSTIDNQQKTLTYDDRRA